MAQRICIIVYNYVVVSVNERPFGLLALRGLTGLSRHNAPTGVSSLNNKAVLKNNALLTVQQGYHAPEMGAHYSSHYQVNQELIKDCKTDDVKWGDTVRRKD